MTSSMFWNTINVSPWDVVHKLQWFTFDIPFDIVAWYNVQKLRNRLKNWKKGFPLSDDVINILKFHYSLSWTLYTSCSDLLLICHSGHAVQTVKGKKKFFFHVGCFLEVPHFWVFFENLYPGQFRAELLQNHCGDSTRHLFLPEKEKN